MNKNPKFKLTKVFDCQNMPKEVKAAFFRLTEGISNGTYVAYDIRVEFYSMNEDYQEGQQEQDQKKLDDWLVENGAEDAPNADSAGESVLIGHWW